MARRSNHVAPKGLIGTTRHYIGDLVYGANDGVVTTFAAVAAVEGGSLNSLAVLVVGGANLIADGLSMGIGNYLAIRSRESAREVDELPEEESEPLRHGAATFLAFFVAGSIPLTPYIAGLATGTRGAASAGLSLATLFLVGSGRGVVTGKHWWKTGLEVLSLGALAGAAAYGAGAVIAWTLRSP